MSVAAEVVTCYSSLFMSFMQCRVCACVRVAVCYIALQRSGSSILSMQQFFSAVLYVSATMRLWRNN